MGGWEIESRGKCERRQTRPGVAFMCAQVTHDVTDTQAKYWLWHATSQNNLLQHPFKGKKDPLGMFHMESFSWSPAKSILKFVRVSSNLQWNQIDLCYKYKCQDFFPGVGAIVVFSIGQPDRFFPGEPAVVKFCFTNSKLRGKHFSTKTFQSPGNGLPPPVPLPTPLATSAQFLSNLTALK